MTTAYSTGIKMMIAAVAAFFIYQYFGLQQGYWSIISIAAITQAAFSKTLIKGFMRTLGTLIGAFLGYLIAILSHGNLIVILSLFICIIFLSSYVAIQQTIFSYGGIVTGLTTVIVLSSTQLNQSTAVSDLAIYRTTEVLLGIFVLLIVNLLMALFLQIYSKSMRHFSSAIKQLPAELNKFCFQSRHSKSAIKITLACLLTFASWLYFRQTGGFWATVSCLLIMEESVTNTKIKGGIRFLAHILTALVSGLVALLLGPHILLRLIPLALGFFACGYLVGSQSKYASLGNTMGIALAIMLLLSPGTSSSLHIILARFLNVSFGIAVAVLITSYLWPKKEAPS